MGEMWLTEGKCDLGGISDDPGVWQFTLGPCSCATAAFPHFVGLKKS